MSWYVLPSGLPFFTDDDGDLVAILLGAGGQKITTQAAVDAAIAAWAAGNPQTPSPVALVRTVNGHAPDGTGNVTITLQSVDLSGKADLVGGKVPTSQISSLSTHETVPVATRAAMLALTSSQVQPGDLAVIGSGGAAADRGLWLLTAADPSVIGSWLHLDLLSGAVQSINNQTGAVTLGAHDVGAPTQQELADEATTARTAEQANATAIALRLTDLADVTVAGTSGALVAGKTSNVAAGGAYTAPALDNPLPTLTPPKRFAVKASTSGPCTITYPDATGTTQQVTILAGEVHTFRQKTTTGWGSESSNKPLAQLDARTALQRKLVGSRTIRAMLDEAVMATPATVSENTASAFTTTKTVRAAGSPKLRFSGAPLTFAQSTYFRPKEPVLASGVATSGSGPARIDFMFQGQIFELYARAQAAFNYRIWKDGQLVAASMATGPIAATVTSADTYIRVDFGARLTKPAHIMVETSGGIFFGGIVHSVADHVGVPQIPSPRVMVVGDSYSAGNGATDRTMAWPFYMARALGWADIWTNAAVAGTGYVKTDNGTHKPFIDRIVADVIPFAPDVVVLQGSVNDADASVTPQPGTVGPAAQACINAIRAALPSCIIVMTSPLWMSSGGTSQSVYESIAAELAAVAALNGLLFVDEVTGNPHFSGTGSISNAKADGNADFYRFSDNTHPSPAGHLALGMLMARLIADKLAIPTL